MNVRNIIENGVVMEIFKNVLITLSEQQFSSTPIHEHVNSGHISNVDSYMCMFVHFA